MTIPTARIGPEDPRYRDLVSRGFNQRIVGKPDYVRAFYREMFAATGGVPVPGDVCDGPFINHPDVDLPDPEWNTSGVPWPTSPSAQPD